MSSPSDDLPSRIAAGLARGLPGATAQLAMCPPYRRVLPDPHPEGFPWRQSAVLVLLHPGKSGAWAFFLIERSSDRGSHRGEMALPGGSMEAGEGPLEAALRETREELGLDAQSAHDIQVLGPLSSLKVAPSGFEIHPFLAILGSRPRLSPSVDEVAACFEPGIDDLLSPSSAKAEKVDFGGAAWDLPFYLLEGKKVWGATAMILAELVALLK